MATKKKLLQAAAGNAGGGAGLDVEEVFSTYLYEGNSSTQTITNGIDLDGEGGLVWLKSRDASSDHELNDTERGVGKRIASNQTYAEQSNSDVSAFNSNGFDLRYQSGLGNASGEDYASWTFRKAPKFFDVVTYTGTNVIRTVSHNLGSVPGMIIVKRTDTTGSWRVYHRGSDATAPENYYLTLNATDQAGTGGGVVWNDTAPTDSVFTVGANNSVNASGGTYVAYLFAHNDGDGEFGADSDADIIKCGSYTGGSGNTEIDLGFEPQWLMIKRTDSAEDWLILDVMRGLIVSGDDVPSSGQKDLLANTSAAEVTPSYAGVSPQPNGFKVRSGLDGLYSTNGGTYIYMAIRRGTKVPESATEVFDPIIQSGTGTQTITTGNTVDLAIFRSSRTSANQIYVLDRMRGGNYLETTTTNAENSGLSAYYDWDSNTGVPIVSGLSSDQTIWWMWKRAPGYFDVVAYSGDGTLNQTFNHNLTVKPDMVWIKNRGRTQDWWVALDDSIVNLDGRLNSSGDFGYSVIGTFTDTTVQTLNQNQFATNYSGDTYIAYLFATLPGISKVGSYTGTGATLNIDCGFTSGARFVFLKRTDAAGQWLTFDSERGIAAGNDPVLFLNSDSAEDSGYDIIDPYSSGFTVTADATYEQNISGGSYIFYAIA